jgi:hypothetical protein
MAAVFIPRSDQLAAITNNPNPVGDQDLIDLFELGDEQTVKTVFKTDSTPGPPLSHVRVLPTDSLRLRGVWSRSGSARGWRRRPAVPRQERSES